MPSSIIPWTRPRGAVHSLEELNRLSSERTEFLCVSERTLYIMQNYAGLDVGFPARYAVEKLPDGYRSVINTDPWWQLLVDVVDAYQLEVESMSCEIVSALEAIKDILAAWQSSSVATGGVCCTYDMSGETWYENAPVDGSPTGLCDLAYNYARDWGIASKEYYAQYARGAFPSVGVLTAILDEFDLPGQTALAMATNMSQAALPMLESLWSSFVDTLIPQIACILYSAVSTLEAKVSIEGAINALEGLPDIARELLRGPITNNSLNKVYDGTWPITVVGGFDCEACGETCSETFWEMGYGDLTVDGSVRPWVAQRDPDNDWYIFPRFDHTVSVEVVSVSSYVDIPEWPDWRTRGYDAACAPVVIVNEELLTSAVGETYEADYFVANSDRSSPDALVMSVIVSEIP